MKGNLVKIATLIILIVLVVVTFNLTKQNEEKKEGLQASSITSSKEENKNDKKEDNEIEIDKDDDKNEEDNDVVVEEEDNIIRQFKLYNSYVITSENTQYKDVDYKYFIIRSYSEFEKYLNEYMIDYSDEDKYISYNKTEKEDILKNIDKDFFNENSVIILSDVNSKKQINGNISEISIDEDKIVDLKIKKETNDNLSNAITYIIPVEKGVKQVKAKHIN